MTLTDQARALTIPHADQPMDTAELRDRLEAVTRLCWEMADENSELREWMAIKYSGVRNLYGDDGHLQDNSAIPFIDYRKDSVYEIIEKINRRREAAEAAEAAKDADHE